MRGRQTSHLPKALGRKALRFVSVLIALLAILAGGCFISYQLVGYYTGFFRGVGWAEREEANYKISLSNTPCEAIEMASRANTAEMKIHLLREAAEHHLVYSGKNLTPGDMCVLKARLLLKKIEFQSKISAFEREVGYDDLYRATTKRAESKDATAP